MKRIAFWGTPELTTKYLGALKDTDMTPVVVITNPDRPKGRGKELASPPAKQWALKNNIQVLQPEIFDDTLFETLSSLDLDVSVVVAYGSLIPKRFIDIPKKGTLNVHYSLLPHLRGASPTETAILQGDTETGCSIQIMRPKLDSGPIIALKKTLIGETENTTELRGRLTDIGAQLLADTLPEYLKGNIVQKEQDETLATYAPKISKEDGLLGENDDENYRKFKAYIEWPRTYFFLNNKRIIVKSAHLEDRRFVIDTVLPEGKKEMSYADFLRGNPTA